MDFFPMAPIWSINSSFISFALAVTEDHCPETFYPKDIFLNKPFLTGGENWKYVNFSVQKSMFIKQP